MQPTFISIIFTKTLYIRAYIFTSNKKIQHFALLNQIIIFGENTGIYFDIQM